MGDSGQSGAEPPHSKVRLKMSILSELQEWYKSNCDGDWEHQYGIHIETLDNPGWSVTIDLEYTNLEGKQFGRIKNHHSEQSWIECWVEDEKYRSFGDPSRLEEIFGVFVTWAKSQNEDWLKPPPPLSEEELQRLEDQNFWDSLGEENGPETCKHDGCYHKRISLSVMCRGHHFEMVKKRSKSI